MIDGDKIFWSPHTAKPLLDDALLVSVEAMDGRIHFAAELGTETKFESRSLRSLLFSETDADLALLSKARQLLHWRRTHQFCGICGSATTLSENGSVLQCSTCSYQFFPRINPCVIVLVTRGNEVLLARSARYRASFYSCLAGFMEVGETPEQTVAREVREEAGVEVDNIRYVESQSWPFPSQLMLGFLANYRAGDIVPDPNEIEDAGWFKVDALPNTPSADISVAGRLIREYRRSLAEAL